MSSETTTPPTDDAESEDLYEVTVELSYTETFDHESNSKEQSEEFGEYLIKEDVAQGDISIHAMDISAEAVKVEPEAE